MIDYLIIGGGMAGCNLTYNLLKNGRSVHLIDENSPHAASNIAAGIYNPLLPRHHKVAYQAEYIYPIIESYYLELEQYLGETIHFKQPIHYFIETQAEQNDWSAHAYNSHLSHWIEVHTSRSDYNFKANNGFLKIKHSGWADAKKMTAGIKAKLMEQGALTNEHFEYSELNISEAEINYKGIKAKHIVFCEGCDILNNTFNTNLALKPAKGEILIIKTELDIDFIAQQGVFMVPLGDQIYKVGSTFSWDTLDETPTEAGKKEIVTKLEKFFKGSYEIIDHYAGVRPSSGDRRPILGALKPYTNAFVFNGLGSKGVALVPYYSTLMTNHLINGIPLDKEISTERYLKYSLL